MSVRKRQWRAANGEIKTAWVCDYFDGNGKRRNETFATKGQAVQRDHAGSPRQAQAGDWRRRADER
jgi:hypothetical protein